MRRAPAGPPQIGGLEFERVLSRTGGYGDVYLYRDRQLDRDVAVKVLREGTHDHAARLRFQTEATTMAGLHHPNVVTIHAVGITRHDLAYFVMAYCPDATLADRSAGGALSVAEVLTTGVEISGALHSAHLAHIIHRDVKPANILTLPWGSSGLTDFGVATRLVGPDADDDDVGVSIPWSPPEMLFTATRGSVATDVYSLAATIWHLLVGRSPFELPGGDNSRLAVMGRIRDSRPPPTGRADVPASLERVLSRGMAKNPEQRYASVEAFARALGAVEEELHLPRTPLVISQQVDQEAKAPARPGGAPARPGAVDVAPPSARLQRARPLGADLPGAATDPAAMRGRAIGLEASAPSGSRSGTALTPPPAGNRGRRLGVAAGLGALLLAGGAAYLAWPDGNQPATPPATVSDSAPPGGLGNDDATLLPGTVEVSGERRGERLVFTWDYAGLLESDSYRWRTDDDREGVVSTPKLTLDAPNGERVCLEVLVVRANGTSTQEYSSPSCAE